MDQEKQCKHISRIRTNTICTDYRIDGWDYCLQHLIIRTERCQLSPDVSCIKFNVIGVDKLYYIYDVITKKLLSIMPVGENNYLTPKPEDYKFFVTVPKELLY